MNADQNEMQRLQTLKAFSAGQISDYETMHALDIDSVEDLFLLMSKHELPMPRLAPAETADMLRQLNELGVFPFTDGESVSNDHVQNLRHDEGIRVLIWEVAAAPGFEPARTGMFCRFGCDP